MSLISQIDALPDDMKVLCGSFAYGLKGDFAYGLKGEKHWEFRVGADVYRIKPSGWELYSWDNYEIACGDRKEYFLRELNSKHVGDIGEAGYSGGPGHVNDGVCRGGIFFKSDDGVCGERCFRVSGAGGRYIEVAYGDRKEDFFGN